MDKRWVEFKRSATVNALWRRMKDWAYKANCTPVDRRKKYYAKMLARDYIAVCKLLVGA